MEEKGIVVAREAGRAKVRIERSDACEGCHACLASAESRYMTADVVDRIGVKPGDKVLIRTEGVAPLRASLLLFGIPLVLVFVGYFVGSALAPVFGAPASAQEIGIGGASVFFLGSFGIIALVVKATTGGKAEKSAIVEILENGEQAG